MDFKAGDLVRVKSGGPLMTVDKVSVLAMTQEPAVWCVWFEKDGSRQVAKNDTFPPTVLEISSKPTVGAIALSRR
ncbi:hypothetical protein IP70_19890 [alpha proteobacterium AAP38]|nr:hypothetical protein IP70_19890 [alpha proteobacterium AAP38]